MPFVRVKPDDMSQVTAVASIEEAARQVDDPDAFPPIAEMLAAEMRYGWDLDAPEHYLYIPEDASHPVGTLVHQGERLGMIRFGSRVDIFLPLGTCVLAHVGDTTRVGVTVVAEWN